MKSKLSKHSNPKQKMVMGRWRGRRAAARRETQPSRKGSGHFGRRYLPRRASRRSRPCYTAKSTGTHRVGISGQPVEKIDIPVANRNATREITACSAVERPRPGVIRERTVEHAVIIGRVTPTHVHQGLQLLPEGQESCAAPIRLPPAPVVRIQRWPLEPGSRVLPPKRRSRIENIRPMVHITLLEVRCFRVVRTEAYATIPQARRPGLRACNGIRKVHGPSVARICCRRGRRPHSRRRRTWKNVSTYRRASYRQWLRNSGLCSAGNG